MTANTIEGGATILQFPNGGRAGRMSDRSFATLQGAALRVANVASGGASYHEEAIRDVVPGRK